MAKNRIYGEDFPILNGHFDPCDKGHTKGHSDHFISLYEQSLESAKTEEEKQVVNEELEKFKNFIGKFNTEYFKLKPSGY